MGSVGRAKDCSGLGKTNLNIELEADGVLSF